MNKRTTLLLLLTVMLTVSLSRAIMSPAAAQAEGGQTALTSAFGDIQRQIASAADDPIPPDGQIGGTTEGLAARGQYVYLGVGPRLVVLDLAFDAAFATYDDLRIGQTEPFPGIVRDVVVAGDYAYVAAGAAGLRVINIADPAAPREVAALDVVENAWAIDHEGTPVYLGDYGPSGLHVIDVSAPAAPRELGAAEWRAGIWEIEAAGDYAYVADGYDLFIFDVSDPAAPRQVGQVGTTCSALDVALAGDHAYVADHDNCGLLVANVSDPTIQTHVSYASPHETTYLNPTLPSNDQHETVRVEVAGNYAYVANKVVFFPDNGEAIIRSRLTVFDITNPSAPDPIAHYNLDENRPYSEVTDLVVDGNAVYLSTVDGWLYVADLTDLRLSNNVEDHLVLGPVVGVIADEGSVSIATPHALHAGFENGLDRSYFLLRQPFEDRAVSWFGAGGVGYVTTDQGVIAFDLHGLDEVLGPMPKELGRLAPPYRPFRTALDGNRLWLFYYREGEVVIADATSPGQLTGGGAVPVPEEVAYSPSQVVVGDGIAYLFYSESPPLMIDLRADPPQSLGFLGGDPVADVAAMGQVAYAATGGEVRRYDVSDPAAPQRLDPLPGVAAPLALGQDGPYLFVADVAGQLHIFDTTAAERAPVAVLQAPYEFVSASVADGRVYVSAGDSGLWAYAVPGLGEPISADPTELVFDNFPLSEAILAYIDETNNLVLQNVDTGAVVQLTDSSNLNRFSIAHTRDRIFYVDQPGNFVVLALDFHSDGRLSVKTVFDSFPLASVESWWSPDGKRLAYRDADFQWWISDLSGPEGAFPLSDRIYYLGGWSPDGQWVFYCTAEYVLEIVNVSGELMPVDQDISCDRIEGGEWPRWSPTAPLLAYARGRIGREPDGLQPVIFNAATGEHIELPVDHFIMDWSPDGRYLALAKEWSAGGQQAVESITITTDQGRVIEELPGYRTDTLGATGWVRATEGEVMYGRYELGDAPGESQSNIDALFGISQDGATRWWGLIGDASFVVLCTSGDGVDTDVYHSFNPVSRDESPSREFSFSQRGIRPLLSREGGTAVIDAYEGGETWRRMLLRCEGGEPLLEEPADLLNRHLLSYSADSRRILSYGSTEGQVAPRVYAIGQSAELLPTSETIGRSAAWLVTPAAAPPVTDKPAPPISPANAIAGRATDAAGAPLSGVAISAAGPDQTRTATTDGEGRYRFDDLPDGRYTLTAARAGYVFAAPLEVTLPPAQLAADFRAGPTTPAPPSTLDDLLGRKEGVIEQLKTTAYTTTDGGYIADPAEAIDETAAEELVAEWRAAAPAAITPQQVAALERLVLQEEAVATLLDDYSLIAEDQAEATVDAVGLYAGSTLLALKASTNTAAAFGDLLKKLCEDVLKLLARVIDDEGLREGVNTSIEGAIVALDVLKDGTLDTNDVPALAEEVVERYGSDRVRAEAFGALIPVFVEDVQPTVDQGVRSVAGGVGPVWEVASSAAAAESHLFLLTTTSSIGRDLAHKLYVDSFGQSRDVTALLTDLADLALIKTRIPIGLIFSLQTRLQQMLVSMAASSVLSSAMTCSRDAALLAGEAAFVAPVRLDFACETPYPVDMEDFLKRLFTQGAKEHHLARLAPPAQSSSVQPSAEFDAALAGYRAAVAGLQAAVAAGDPDDVRARVAQLSAAAQAFDEAATPVMARLGLADEAEGAAGEMALGLAISFVRLDAGLALLATETWLDDPDTADTAAFDGLLTAATDNVTLLEQVQAEVPLPAAPEVALPVVDAPVTWAAVLGEVVALPVQVSNAGTRPFGGALLTLEADGRPVATQALPNLAPGESAEVMLEYAPDAAGHFRLRVNAVAGEKMDYRTIDVIVSDPAAARSRQMRTVLFGAMAITGSVLLLGLGAVMWRRRQN